MKLRSIHLLKCLIIFILISCLYLKVSGKATYASQRYLNTSNQNEKKIVVIDPGHGGMDTGAISADGLMEKDLTLHASRLFSKQMSPFFHVVSTRTDDYHINAQDRNSLANNAKGDVFISLHAGGAFAPVPSGITLYVLDGGHLSTSVPSNISSSNENIHLKNWENVHKLHLHNSRTLAEFIQFELKKLDNKLKVHIISAPIYTLIGLDMPAVVIEMGMITHPAESNKLRQKRHLMLIGQAIFKSIQDFLKKIE